MFSPLVKGALRLVSLPAIFAQTPPAESFDDLARQAESLLDSRPEEAAALYKRALEQRPSWAEGWFYLGAASYKLNRFPEARNAFQK
ncbi:MAG: tetratricopeptide repeat protein, partial [Bryobacteraceae bacterium]